MGQRDVMGTRILPGTKTAHKDAVLFTAGAAIDANDICYVSGAGARAVTLTSASSAAPATARGTLYVSKNAVASGHDSEAYAKCTITGVDTSAGAVGDPVYLSTGGSWSLTPGATARRVGTVAVVSASVGEIAFDGHFDDGGIWTSGVTTIDMADATHTLVLGTAAANQTQITGNVLFVDPSSGGASENLDLPAVAACKGMVLFIFNTGGEGIVVRGPGPVTVITLDTAQHGMVACDGSAWRGFMGAIT